MNVSTSGQSFAMNRHTGHPCLLAVGARVEFVAFDLAFAAKFAA